MLANARYIPARLTPVMYKVPRARNDAWYKVGVYDSGLHLLYLGVLAHTLPSMIFFRVAQVLSALGAIVLLWGALRAILRQFRTVCLPISVQIGALFMPPAVVILLFNMTMFPGPIYYRPMAFVPYLWVLVALGGVDELEWSRLKNAFRIHALVGTMAFFGLTALGYSWEYEDRSSFITESVKMADLGGVVSPLLQCVQLMYSYPILLIMFPEETWFWRGVGVAVTLGSTVWGILSGFRSVLILGVGLAILCAIYSWQRARSVGWSRKLIAVCVLAACALGGWRFVAAGRSEKAVVLNTAVGAVIQRMGGDQEESGSASSKNVRYVDAAYYLANLTIAHAIIGEPGGWESPSGFVMHVGYLRYIVWGGLPTLIAVCLLVYWQGWWGMLVSRRLSVLAAASVVALHSVQALAAGMLNVFPSSAIIFLCAGYCWHSMAPKRNASRAYRVNCAGQEVSGCAMLRVCWFTNVPFPSACAMLGMPNPFGGGWLSSLALR